MGGRDERGERILINPQGGPPQNFKQIVDMLRAQITQIDATLKRQDLPREIRRAIETQRFEIEQQLKMLEEMPALQR